MAEMIEQTDFQILDWIQANLRNPWLDWIMPTISFLCNGGWFWIALAVLCLIWKKHRRCGMNIAMGLILCGLFGNILLKHLAARSRPCWINTNIDMLIAIPTDYSFPSGHTLHSFIGAISLWKTDRRMGYAALPLAVLIAFSRLYLYVHFPTDILGGAILGILIVLLVYYFGEKVRMKLSERKQDMPAE